MEVGLCGLLRHASESADRPAGVGSFEDRCTVLGDYKRGCAPGSRKASVAQTPRQGIASPGTERVVLSPRQERTEPTSPNNLSRLIRVTSVILPGCLSIPTLAASGHVFASPQTRTVRRWQIFSAAAG